MRPASLTAAARPGRSCSPWTSSAPSPGGCRSGSCTSEPGPSAWPCRCPLSPGRDLPPTMTSDTGSPHPEPVTGLAGSRKLVDTTRRLLGVPVWGHQGTSRIRLAPVVDPALIRSLDVGQAAYIYRGGVTFVQVKRLVGGPAALPGPAGVTVPSAGRPARGQVAPARPAHGQPGPPARGGSAPGPPARDPAAPAPPARGGSAPGPPARDPAAPAPPARGGS